MITYKVHFLCLFKIQICTPILEYIFFYAALPIKIVDEVEGRIQILSKHKKIYFIDIYL